MAFIYIFIFFEKIWKSWKNWNYLHKIFVTMYSICYTRVLLFKQDILTFFKHLPVFSVFCGLSNKMFFFSLVYVQRGQEQSSKYLIWNVQAYKYLIINVVHKIHMDFILFISLFRSYSDAMWMTLPSWSHKSTTWF